MKKILALALAAAMTVGTMVFPAAAAEEKTTINLWSFTDELGQMMDKYLELNPDMAAKYDINKVVINNDGSAYINALDTALMNGEPDIYGGEADYVVKYTQGDCADFAASYADLGIDVEAALKDGEIAPYTIEAGTRPSDNALVALAYQSTGGAFIYRRSIAKAVWGNDDPAFVAEKIGAGSGTWDAFFTCAEEMKQAGYKMVSGDVDLWPVVRAASEKGWVVDGALYIDPMRESLLDLNKQLHDNDYYNATRAWQEAWFADMTGPSKVFSFYGPAWLLNYTIAQHSGDGENSSAGDWGVCESNIGFYWGGTYLLASKTAAQDPAKVELLKGFINWVTLDTSDTSLQSLWANGKMNENGTKDTVSSAVVLKNSNGEAAFTAGQNIFDVFVPANANAKASSMCQYDSVINDAWTEACAQYAAGEVDRDTAITNFKMDISGKLDIEIDF